MSTIAGVAAGLQGAMLLARGRAEGMDLMTARAEPELAVAARSFWAAALCLPAFLCLELIDFAEAQSPPPDAHGIALQLLGYVVYWAAFALLSRWLARTVGRDSAWPRFISAWNWCNVVQYLLFVASSLPGLLGLPDTVGQTAWLVATGWALWLEWYATRLALGVNGLQAAGIVALDEALGTGLLAMLSAAGGLNG